MPDPFEKSDNPSEAGFFRWDPDRGEAFRVPPEEAMVMPERKVPVEIEPSQESVEPVLGEGDLVEAQGIEAFLKVCDQFELQNRSIEIGGQVFGGDQIRGIIESTQASLQSSNSMDGARHLSKIPKSELRDRIEELLNFEGLVDTAEELRTAYEQLPR